MILIKFNENQQINPSETSAVKVVPKNLGIDSHTLLSVLHKVSYMI